MRHVAISGNVVKDNTGIVTEIPAIMTKHGLLASLLNYFLERSQARSQAWMTKVVQSVRLACPLRPPFWRRASSSKKSKA